MRLISTQKSIIERVVNCFETGKSDGDYGSISIYADGPHDIRQITYGRSQTTEYGKLRQLVRMYVDAQGMYSNALQTYTDRVGSKELADDTNFKSLLRRAGREDALMRRIQDRFFNAAFFAPAMKWADDHKFTLPLSALVIYDSFIHSGSILWIIRQKFRENPPDLGGDEKKWIKSYVRARHEWLSQHRRPAVRASAYRIRDLEREVTRGNWNLAKLPIMANGIAVYPE
jgi:chitosanase